MGEANKVTGFEALRAQILAQHHRLPPQLQRIAQYVLDNPQRVALMTVADLAEEIEVQPSGVIRFSKAVGYSGFSEIQRILKDQLGDLLPSSYYARLNVASGEGTELARAAGLAEASLAALPEDAAIASAADILTTARIIHVVGLRRAFGTASYFAYLLSGFEAPVRQITGIGDMGDSEMMTLQSDDVLVAISFPSYRPETRAVVARARQVGAKIIAITDSNLSPIARGAAQLLLTDQQADAGFRSTVGSVVTVQALAMEYGRRRKD
ncbi:MAG: MurR/RpiR family transcriptional regulator [Pseudomonadota bacterium]